MVFAEVYCNGGPNLLLISVIARLITMFFPEYHSYNPGESFFTRRRIIFVMFLFISVTALFFIQYNSSQILGSYDTIEMINMNSSLNSLQFSLLRQSDILHKTTRDYAGWDETARYVLDHNIPFESENLNKKSLKNLGVSFVSVIDGTGNVLYLKWYDPETYDEIPIKNQSLLVSALQGNDSTFLSSILGTPDNNPLLVSGAPITSSDGNAHSGGFLFFGIPLKPVINTTIRNAGMSGFLVNLITPLHSDTPFHSFVLSPDGSGRITSLNETSISGEIVYSGNPLPGQLIITIFGEKRYYGQGKSFVTSYFWRSIVFSLMALTVGVLIMVGLIRKYDQTRTLIGTQEQEIALLRDRREILDKFHVILDRYLHAGPDTDQNIAMIAASAGGLFNAEYVLYIRIENGRSAVVGSWPDSNLWLSELVSKLVSSHHPFQEIAEDRVIPVSSLISFDMSQITVVNPSVRGMLFRSVRPNDDLLGYLFMFLSSDECLNETNQIVLDLLLNVLSGEENRRIAKSSLHKRDVILEAIGHSATRLLGVITISSIGEILRTFVEQIEVDEAHLFLWDSDANEGPILTHDYFWSNETSKSSSNHLIWDDLLTGPINGWFSGTSSPEIRAGPPCMFPHERESLENRGIRSIVFIPLHSHNKCVGALFLVDWTQDRYWIATELDALKIASGLIMATVAKIERDEAIRDREENFKQFFNQIRDFIFVLDTEGRIITANLFALQEIGIKSSDLRGMHLSGIFTTRWMGDSPLLGIRPLPGSIHERTAILLTIEGKEIPVELRQLPGVWNGEQAIFCICKDISGLKRSEHKFATAFRSSQVLHAILDLRTDQLIDMNATFCDTVGFLREELLNLPDFSVNLIFDHTQIQKTKEVILTLGSIQDFEVILRTREGEMRTGSLYGALIEIDGEPCVLYSIVDITDRKLAEVRIQTLLHELSDSNQELQGFAHVVAHDLKEPLRGIYSLISWISEDHHDGIGPDGQRYVEMIIDQVQRMNNLIDGILTYSQAGYVGEESESVSIRSIVHEVLELLNPPSGIVIAVDTNLPILFGERTKIQQVFQNLISNSLTYLGRDDGEIRIRAQPYGETWLFEISDNGPGIDPSLHKSIFEIFKSFSQPWGRRGTGIGLSIVKRVVESSGGSVWVESAPGHGASFFFTFASPGIVHTNSSGDFEHDTDSLYRR